MDFERLGLVDGETYQLRFFYANRQLTQAVFRFRTNVVLAQAARGNAISAQFD